MGRFPDWIPSYNPTRNLIDAVEAQGYPTGNEPPTITDYPDSTWPGRPAPEDAMAVSDIPAGPSEAEALKPKGPGDVHPVKFSPYSSDQGM